MATKYVATTGNNANSGNDLANAWLTPTYAITNTGNGDTIYFADGNYPAPTNTLTTARTLSAINMPDKERRVNTPGFYTFHKVTFYGSGANAKLTFNTNAHTWNIIGIEFVDINTTGGSGVFGLAVAGLTLNMIQSVVTHCRIRCGFDEGGIFSISGNNFTLNLDRFEATKNYRINPNTDSIGAMLIGGFGTGGTMNVEHSLIYLDGTAADQFSSTYGAGARWNSGSFTANVSNSAFVNVGSSIPLYLATVVNMNNCKVRGWSGTITGFAGGADNVTLGADDPFVNVNDDNYDPIPGGELSYGGLPL